MKLTESNNHNGALSPGGQEGLPFDPKRVLFQVTRYWYLLLLSVLVGIAIAYLINRYSTKIYSVEASIIIKESEEVSGGELLYNNPLVKFYRNYLNEIYIIKSVPLMERTVTELNFDEAFFKVGNLITSESYKMLPFHVHILSDNTGKKLSFSFKVLDRDRFEVLSPELDGNASTERRFGEPIEIGEVSIELTVNHPSVLDDYLGQEFAYSYMPAQDVALSYISRISAQWAEEGSGVINLSLKGSNPQKEIDFLSGLIKNYQEYDLEKKNQTATNTIVFISQQLKNISDSLNKAERQLEVFKNKNIVTDLNGEASRLYQKIEGLELQKTDLLIRDRYYKYLRDYINTGGGLDQVILPSSVGIDDPILTGLVSEMIKMQTDIKLLTNSDKLRNPLVVEGTRRIVELKSSILESLNNLESVDKIKLEFLNDGIKDIESQLSHLPIAERQFVNIKRNYSLLENLYVFLLQKHAEAGISRASNTTDIVVVNPPIASGPISPSPTRNYVVACALGAALPVLFFIFAEVFNRRVQSREDIEQVCSIPFIGGIGHKRNETNIEVLQRPKSAISESFRALRSNLNYFMRGKEKGVILITSSISGEGKTFSSINIAAVFALSGQRTLIVGADMRKPKIFPDFNLSNSTGLSQYLAGFATFGEVVQSTSFPNLDLVSAGPVPPNPSELILSNKMTAFIEEAKNLYDYIFVDSPPLALVTDAFVLSSLVDHTLFIVRQNYTPKMLLKSINEYYTAGKISNISIVLNDIYKSGPGYGYGYNYGYGYGYGYTYGLRKSRAHGYYEE